MPNLLRYTKAMAKKLAMALAPLRSRLNSGVSLARRDHGMRTKPALWVVAIAVAIALVPTLPYGYYSVMRWVVCALCAWLALSSYRAGREEWAWAWGVFAGIYNPIFTGHANREERKTVGSGKSVAVRGDL